MASCSDGLLMELLHPRELIPGELDEDALPTRCAFLYSIVGAGKGRINQSGVAVRFLDSWNEPFLKAVERHDC